MRAIFWIFLFHFLSLGAYILITEISTPVVLGIFLSLIFCVIPILFKSNSYQRYYESRAGMVSNTNSLIYLFFLSLPIIILIWERATYGFEISANPVMMRDQMLQRHRDGGGGGIYAIIGNFCHILAMFFLYKYSIFEKSSTLKTFFSICYVLLAAWIAGSRAMLLLVLILIWTQKNLNFPSLKQIMPLCLILLGSTYIFILRAERSDIDLTVYLFEIFDHLRVPYSDLGESILRSFIGPIVASIIYIIHSLQAVGDILVDTSTKGISFAPLAHFLSLFTDFSNRDYAYQGLFVTSFGMFYHDFGMIGVSIILFIKCSLMYFASRSSSKFFGPLLVTILVADSVMGIWTSIINIVFFIYILLGLILLALMKDIKLKWGSSK